MTMLEKLKGQRDTLLATLAETAATSAHLWTYQELLYRIEVLEVFQMFHRTAPCTTDAKVLCGHYQMVDAYIHHLSMERQYGKPADDIQKKHRETALGNLGKVIADYRKRMNSFRATTAEAYGKEVGAIIQNVVIVWVQHRCCYVDVNKMMEEIAK